MKVVMLEGSTSRYNLSMRYTFFLNIFDNDVAIVGDDKGVLEFSGAKILKVVVKHVSQR